MDQQVYFIRNRTTGNVKIGFASSVEHRLATLQTGSDGDLMLLRVEDGGPERKRALHERFKADRVRGDWFRTSGELGKYLEIEEIEAMEIESGVAPDPRWSSQRYHIANRVTGARWLDQRLALMPEPNMLACLGDWRGPEIDGCPVAFYVDELRRWREWPMIREQGWVPIYWSVAFEGNGTWLSPFPNPELGSSRTAQKTWFDQDFTCPIDAKTGEPIDWYSLPIRHRFPAFWRALGFDPAPFQTRFDLRPVLARAA